jgi:hypothetical protein
MEGVITFVSGQTYSLRDVFSSRIEKGYGITSILIFLHIYIYIYIYMCVCVCVCVNRLANDTPLFLDQSKTDKR